MDRNLNEMHEGAGIFSIQLDSQEGGGSFSEASIQKLLGNKTKMPELKIITLPKRMTLVERILEVSKQLSEWLESLESPFDVETDVLELARYEQNEKKFRYYYILDRGVKGPKESPRSSRNPRGSM